MFYIAGTFYQWLCKRGGLGTGVPNRLSVFALCIVTFTFSVLTYQRNNIWQDSKTLWTDTLKKSPNSPIAHINLGEVYHDSGRLDDAVREYKVALSLAPGASGAYYNLGLIYLFRNQFDKAVNAFKAVVKLNPNMGDAHYNLGTAYSEQRKLDDAIASFQLALKFVHDPDLIASIHNNLGNVYARKGSLEEAIEAYERALIIIPGHKNSLRNRTIVRNKLNMTQP